MKPLRSLLLAGLAIFAAASVHATTVVAPTFDELVTRAQLIFEGTVTEVQSQWAGEGGQRHIVSYVTLQVNDGLKGDAGATYTLRMLGGTVGDYTMGVSDAPQLKVGDRNILFVENNGTQAIPLVGIMHGQFRVQQDAATGADVVVNHEGAPVSDVARIGKDEQGERTMTDHHEAANDGKPALTTSTFKAAIQAKLAEAAQ